MLYDLQHYRVEVLFLPRWCLFLKTKQKTKKPKPAFESLGALRSIAMEISVSCNLMFGFLLWVFFFSCDLVVFI